jgi:DNA polymerase-3 subunit gamma/tau
MAIEQAVPGALDDAEPETEVARALAPLLAPDETQLLYGMVVHGRAELALMSDEHGALTMVLLRFLAFPPAGSVPAPPPQAQRAAAPLRAPAPPALAVVPARVAVPRPETAVVAAVAVAAEPVVPPFEPAPPRVVEAAVPAFAAAAPSTALADRWQATVQALIESGTVAALVRELAWQAGLVAIDAATTPPTWRLAVAREPLRNPALADKLALALAAQLGEPVQLALQPGQPDDTPAQRDAADRAWRQAAAEALIEADPVVRELLGQFKTARLVPGSIRPV